MSVESADRELLEPESSLLYDLAFFTRHWCLTASWSTPMTGPRARVNREPGVDNRRLPADSRWWRDAGVDPMINLDSDHDVDCASRSNSEVVSSDSPEAIFDFRDAAEL
jgi:hypothetical protein